MKVKLVGVIGLGLIGGSIARALKEKLHIDVIGVDSNSNYIKQALSSGTIVSGSESISDLSECDIVFLCVPVAESIKILSELHKTVKSGCIITDVGSTKEEIMNFVENSLPLNLSFIGGHPMAGSEKSGFLESKPHLFENAYYILTPRKNSTGRDIEILKEMVKGIGAIPLVLDARHHDLITAAISHVPHVIASSLVSVIKNLDNNEQQMHKLAAGGFKDITRIASSNPQMWQNICFSNKNNICKVIDEYIDNLKNFKELIINNSCKKVFDFFNEAKIYRDSFPVINRGPIEPLYNLFVDVEDKPGVIGEIATVLGKHNINIKNIGISNSREYQAGCLVISFYSKERLGEAYMLLESKGYMVEK